MAKIINAENLAMGTELRTKWPIELLMEVIYKWRLSHFSTGLWTSWSNLFIRKLALELQLTSQPKSKLAEFVHAEKTTQGDDMATTVLKLLHTYPVWYMQMC